MVMLLRFYGISVLQYFRPKILRTYDTLTWHVAAEEAPNIAINSSDHNIRASRLLCPPPWPSCSAKIQLCHMRILSVHCREGYLNFPYIHTVSQPNKHGNSVTNLILSFQIILWFSLVIPTEKAVICESFVCYVYILFVYVLTAYGCT